VLALALGFSAVAFAATGTAVAPTETTVQSVALLSSNVLFVQLVVILFLVILDVVLTVAYAIGTGKFEWAKLLDFLRTNVAKYALVWGVLAAIGWASKFLGITDSAITSFGVFTDIVYALIVARLTASIFTSFKDMGIDAAAAPKTVSKK